jgi:hypothetical protein
VLFKNGAEPLQEFRQRGWVSLSLADLLVNTSDKPVELNFVDRQRMGPLFTLKLEPKGILFGAEIKARLASTADDSVDRAVGKLKDSTASHAVLWEIRNWGCLAVGALQRAAWNGDPSIRSRARDFLLGLPLNGAVR